GGPDESLQSVLVDGVALVEVDRAPGVPLEARVEETGRVVQRSALRERHLHDALVRLARAEDAVVRPHWRPPPLPLLDHVRVGGLDERADPRERLPAPVVELAD